MRSMYCQLYSKYIQNSIYQFPNVFHTANPVLISSPTGSGKTTFIVENLIPTFLYHFGSTCADIVILSNRIALDTQIKQSIFGLLSKKYPFLLFRKIYTKHLFLSDLPPEEQFEPAIREDEEPISYVGERIRITILRYQSAGYLKYFNPLT